LCFSFNFCLKTWNQWKKERMSKTTYFDSEKEWKRRNKNTKHTLSSDVNKRKRSEEKWSKENKIRENKKKKSIEGSEVGIITCVRETSLDLGFSLLHRVSALTFSFSTQTPYLFPLSICVYLTFFFQRSQSFFPFFLSSLSLFSLLSCFFFSFFSLFFLFSSFSSLHLSSVKSDWKNVETKRRNCLKLRGMWNVKRKVQFQSYQ
jgi:hypothetical protein